MNSIGGRGEVASEGGRVIVASAGGRGTVASTGASGIVASAGASGGDSSVVAAVVASVVKGSAVSLSAAPSVGKIFPANIRSINRIADSSTKVLSCFIWWH